MTMAKTTKDGAEPRVVALAQQLGTVLGRAQAKADKLLKQVNESTAAAKKLAAPKLRSESYRESERPDLLNQATAACS
jgi:hypothetical protein